MAEYFYCDGCGRQFLSMQARGSHMGKTRCGFEEDAEYSDEEFFMPNSPNSKTQAHTPPDGATPSRAHRSQRLRHEEATVEVLEMLICQIWRTVGKY
jgi:hypothetical protein